MIIGTDLDLEVGKTYDEPNEGFTDMPFSHDIVRQRFLVLREATAEEFIDHYKAEGGSDLGCVFILMKSKKFFQISMD